MTDDERSDLTQEERIAQVLRRRPRDTRIPPFAAIQTRLQRRAPLPWRVSAGVVVILLALVVGSSLAERRAATPAATAAPSPTAAGAATVTPRTSPSAPVTASPAVSVLSDRFGFVWVQEPFGLRVRPETGQDGFEVAALPYGFSSCSCAVSPDGTRLAYWTSRMPGNVELRVLEVARPAQQTTIYTAPADQRISAAAWSSDGSGILFSVEGISAPGGPVGDPPSTALLAIEASGGTPRVLAEGGGVYVPLGWDRTADAAAAGVSGEGGYMRAYVTVRTSGDSAPQRTPIAEDLLMFAVDVSTDQRFVLGLFSDPLGSTLRWWRLGDLGTIQSGPRLDHAVRPKWRPFTTEIGWVEGGVLQLLDVERGTRRTGGTFPATDYGLSAFRWDGSAVAGASGSGPTTLVLLEIASGRSERITSAGAILVGAVRFLAAPAAPTATPTSTPPSERTGTITGRLAYGSEFIPPLTVYAIRTDGSAHVSVDTPLYQVACSIPCDPYESPPPVPEPTYTITGVPPGTYVVIAYRNDGRPPDWPAGYSQYLLCGGGVECRDHSLVEVVVGPGEVVRDIDPTDWDDPNEHGWPPRPE